MKKYTLRVTKRPMNDTQSSTADFVIVHAESDEQAVERGLRHTKLSILIGQPVEVAEVKGPKARLLAEGRLQPGLVLA